MFCVYPIRLVDVGHIIQGPIVWWVVNPSIAVNRFTDFSIY